MNLCVDVGNSTINVGIFKDEKIIRSLSLTTDLVKTSDEYQDIIIKQIAHSGQIEDVMNIVYSSVVPEINFSLKDALGKIFPNASIMSVGPGIKTGLVLNVDHPSEVGGDLIADLVGAKEKYSYPLIIMDLGTASKVLLLDKNGSFSSALILPGLTISLRSLSNKAAMLPSINLDKPKSIMAKNTFEAMNAGIVYGHADMLCGLVKRLEKELGYSCKHILTGGNANIVKDYLDIPFIYDENLVLEGLNSIGFKNGGKKNER